MEKEEKKSFSYYIQKIRERIEELELENEVLEEVIKIQHEVIISLSKGKDKEFFKSLKTGID